MPKRPAHREEFESELDPVSPWGSDVAHFGGPCPVCGQKVKDKTCTSCGWDEFGGNVSLSDKGIERYYGGYETKGDS